MSITGEPGRPPVRAGVPTADLSAGMYAVIGILTALIARQKSNRGVEVETSLFHSQLALLTYVAAFCLFSGEIPPHMGSSQMGTVPSQVFRTRDSYMAVEAGFNKHFDALCDALGRPELSSDERFKDRQSRRDNRVELIPILEREFEKRTTSEWIRLLVEQKIACGPVNNVAQALQSPQSLEYGTVQELPFGNGSIKVVRTPLWFDGESRHAMSPPPKLGEHTVEVLSNFLGYDQGLIDRLLTEGAVSAAQIVKR